MTASFERTGPTANRLGAPEQRSRFGGWIGGILLVLAWTGLPAVAEGSGNEELAAGPMLGYVELRSTSIWLQTRDQATVQLRYYPEGISGLARMTPVLQTDASEDHIANFILSELEPGNAYRYEIYINGQLAVRPYDLRFETQPLWQWRTDPPSFRALLGSCAYVNDTPYDRPGRPYGSDFEIFSSMATEEADFMLWLGDNVYLREADFFSADGIRDRYRKARSFEDLQPLLASTHHYATWDDHDFGPNNSDGFYPLKDVALEQFQSYWPAVRYGMPGVPGVFQRFQWSDCEFITVDDRYYRYPENWPQEPGKRFLGESQMAWLKATLLGSRATFKFVACGSQVLNEETSYETFAHYEHERTELIDFIRENKIEGVVFLSGDRHHSELIRMERKGLYPLYDFTSSPLTAGASDRKPGDPEFENSLRVPGTLVGEHSYGILEISGPSRERLLVFKSVGVDGTVFWEHTITREELSFEQ